jgi:Fur family transcriptional regulator, ferric uptake regulator
MFEQMIEERRAICVDLSALPAPSRLSPEAVERALTQLQRVTLERGMKRSKVREGVARVALGFAARFSMDELLSELRGSQDGPVHTTTVYRILPVLIDAGLLRSVMGTLREGARYEVAFEREACERLLCIHCGACVMLRIEALEALRLRVAEKFSFRLSTHVHELRGTCSNCQRMGAREAEGES